MSRPFESQSPFSFSWKYKDFEIRTSNYFNNSVPQVELVKWFDSEHTQCFVLATYHCTRDGGDWKFVGARPFEEIMKTDVSEIWKQLWLCSQLFDDWAEKENENEHR